jgi:hypothetical protein
LATDFEGVAFTGLLLTNDFFTGAFLATDFEGVAFTGLLLTNDFFTGAFLATDFEGVALFVALLAATFLAEAFFVVLAVDGMINSSKVHRTIAGRPYQLATALRTFVA